MPWCRFNRSSNLHLSSLLQSWHCTDAFLRFTVGLTGAEGFALCLLTCSQSNNLVNAPILSCCTVGLTGATEFFSWSSKALSNAPMPMLWFIWWSSVWPMARHRFNWCSIADTCPIRCGGYLSIFCWDCDLASRRWFGHFSMVNWTHWISSMESRNLQIWSHKLVSSIDYVATQSLKS